MSIVADASLGLQLFADQVPDSELYAADLGQRREALLRNWDRLHELRSVLPGKAPSARALRLEVESEALTALAVALTAGASSGELAGTREPQPDGSAISPEELRVFGAELTQTLTMRRKTVGEAAAKLAVPPVEVARWPAGEELPSTPQARALDEYLRARGAIQRRVTELRSGPDLAGPRLVPVQFPNPPAPTLMQTFQGVAAALRQRLAKDADGRPAGWPPDLRMPGHATAASTSTSRRPR